MMAAPRARRMRAYLNVDSRQVMWFVALLLIGLVAVSFTMSFNALVAIAPWTGLPPMLFWTVPLTIDSGIVIFTMAALVMRARAQFWATAYAWALLLLFTCLSIAANVMHAVDATSGEEFRRVITGAVLAGAAPFVVATASHMLSLVVVEPTDAPVLPARPRASAVAKSVVSEIASAPSRVTPISVPMVASVVDDQIREALAEGTVPTGRDIGQWLGGKSPRTGQRHLARLTESDPQLGRLLAELTGVDENSTDRSAPSWAVTA